MDPTTSSLPATRRLPDNFDPATPVRDGGAARQGALSRPPAAKGFRALQAVAVGTGALKQIAGVNPNRVTLLIRASGGVAGNFGYLRGTDDGSQGNFIIKTDETLVLDCTGPLWCEAGGGQNIGTLYVAETYTTVPQE